MKDNGNDLILFPLRGDVTHGGEDWNLKSTALEIDRDLLFFFFTLPCMMVNLGSTNMLLGV